MFTTKSHKCKIVSRYIQMWIDYLAFHEFTVPAYPQVLDGTHLGLTLAYFDNIGPVWVTARQDKNIASQEMAMDVVKEMKSENLQEANA